MLSLCRQSEALYVSLFNEGGLDLLLDRKHPSCREPFLTAEQQQELKQIILTYTPAKLGWNIASSWNTRIIQPYIRERYGGTMSREGIRKLRLS
ncbi:helix-turn-helix domain-containing protein [Aeribacillus composti]|uniref:helix-turn-helix domain-containing protein n=1 Tax=Aeribacillus composti TaxID=1868734 RepID=UPI00406A1935